MVLLNHLFGSPKAIAKELIMDDNKRISLWTEHVSNYASREQLSKHFKFDKVDAALKDFETTKSVLDEIVALISPELVNIENEEKTDKEILADLNKLKTNDQLDKLSDDAVFLSQKQAVIIEIFNEILVLLKTELHLIKLIKQNPSRELLLELFKMIFHKEARLYIIFREQFFCEESKPIHQNIMRIAKAIILEQEVKELLETAEEKFAREVISKMDPSGSKNKYRTLGEDIYFELTEMVDAPFSKGDEVLEGIRQMEELMKDDKLMYVLIKKLRRSYNDTAISGIILAFRSAYNLGHFLDLEGLFAT